MKILRPGSRAVLAASAILVLCSCNGGGPSGAAGSGFRSQYYTARQALEAGRYSAAISRYDALLRNAGPLESRLRLEKAHALLRADRYEEAAREASLVAAAHQDNRRAAALSVLGTAEHRMAQVAMTQGDFGPQTKGHLQRALVALDEMLNKAPDLDPLGGMAERRQMIRTSLRRF